MKKYKLVALLSLAAMPAYAQVANISSTDGSVSGVNLNVAGVNGISQTYFANDGYTFLHVRNNGAPVTATIITGPASITKTGFGSVALTSTTVSIPSSTILGPFPPARFNNANGAVGVSFTSVTGVSVTAIKDTMDGR